MKDWLIIDGYNLLHQMNPGLSKANLAASRTNLLIRLEPLVEIIARKITVVFDGRLSDAQPVDAGNGPIEVIYATAAQTADSVIERLVWNAGNPADILVVSSDRLIRDAVSARGADTIASSLFIVMLNEYSLKLSARIQNLKQKQKSLTFRDIFPDIKTS